MDIDGQMHPVAHNNTYSLLEKFGVTKLDISNRSFAGLYVNKKISTANEHIQCIREYWQNEDFDKHNQVAVLHFIQADNALVAFIATMPFLPYRRANKEAVVQAIIEAMPRISSIFLYNYPDTICQLYGRCSFTIG